MAILFEVFRDGEKYISLTEHSIKNIRFESDKAIDLNPKINDITRSIIITGIINNDRINEPERPLLDEDGEQIMDENNVPQYELREIDSVRKLANLSIIPEYCDCYCDLEVRLTNTRGDLVREGAYENLFVKLYEEEFDDETGHGTFFVYIREREVRLTTD